MVHLVASSRRSPAVTTPTYPINLTNFVVSHCDTRSAMSGYCPPPSASSLLPVGEDFLYVFKPGRHGPDAPPLAPAYARSRFAPRARRAAGARHGVVVVLWLCPGEGGAHCAEPPPQRQARCASRSLRPLRRTDRLTVIVTVASGSRPEGPEGSGVNGLTPGPLRLLGRLSPAGQGPAVGDTRLPLPLFAVPCLPGSSQEAIEGYMTEAPEI